MKAISQEVVVSASPGEVYSVFMDSVRHAEFTGSEASIDNKVGGSFDVWDGYASGKNIELIPGQKIVQSWRANDWPEGQESEITINLTPFDEKTRLLFTQKNIPDDFVADIEEGWRDYYWEPLKEYFEEM